MDTHSVAEYAVTHLTPALPYLLEAGRGAAKKIGESTGSAISDVAGRLWAAVQGKPEAGQPALLDAAKEVAAAPEDRNAQGSLRLQLRKLLDADPELAKEFIQIIGPSATQQNRVTAAGTGSIAVGGGVTGSTISTDVKG